MPPCTRLAAPGLGLETPLDEIIVGAGLRLLVLRSIQNHPDLFVCALLGLHGIRHIGNHGGE